jgi:hypothetical protein
MMPKLPAGTYKATAESIKRVAPVIAKMRSMAIAEIERCRKERLEAEKAVHWMRYHR